MNSGTRVDGLLVTWGDRLFYPANRIVKADPPPHLHARADTIRKRIAATVRHAPQAIVRVTGGGKGMAAIADHLRYISKTGRLELEDDRGAVREGREVVRDIVDQWRHSGTFIANETKRREALNILLSMPTGTDPELLKKAAREFARTELADHRYVMVLHKHQTSPHVHLCVRMEAMTGKRLSHGRSDLSRWRETFAERLQAHGIEAEATYPSVRGDIQRYDPLWRLKAKEAGRLRTATVPIKNGPAFQNRCAEAAAIWSRILLALNESEEPGDRKLAVQVTDFCCRTPYIAEVLRQDPQAMPSVRRYLEGQQQREVAQQRQGLEWGR